MTTVVNIRGNIPRGWERDPSYVYVGRPGHGHDGRWGNRHHVGHCPACGRYHRRGEAVAYHREDVYRLYVEDPGFRAALEGLRGKSLVCFCAPKPCHAWNYVWLLHVVAPRMAA